MAVASAGAGRSALAENDPLCAAAILARYQSEPLEPPASVWSEVLACCDSSSAAGLVAQGVGDLEAGDLDAARAAFEAARAADGDWPYPHHYLARIAVARNNPGQAIVHLREAIHHGRYFVPAYRLLGRVNFELGANDKGFAALRTVIALAPGNACSHFELGRAYLEHGRPEHAIVELQRAQELDPGLLEARYLLGRARIHAGLLEEGFADLQAYVVAARGLPPEQERVARAESLIRRFAGPI